MYFSSTFNTELFFPGRSIWLRASSSPLKHFQHVNIKELLNKNIHLHTYRYHLMNEQWQQIVAFISLFRDKTKKNITRVLILISSFFNLDGSAIIPLDLSGKYTRINIYISKWKKNSPFHFLDINIRKNFRVHLFYFNQKMK